MSLVQPGSQVSRRGKPGSQVISRGGGGATMVTVLSLALKDLTGDEIRENLKIRV